ncbi:MAG: extracellular solute-binding protein [Candidatus Schekmanbacteria bacterium]|nr:extracellular solute-binding protein [Candidatus Schekmanbacteria bacterium]
MYFPAVFRSCSRLVGVLTLIFVLLFCPGGRAEEISGNLVIFHAGSLAAPFQVIYQMYKTKYPKVNILNEAAGSLNSVRKITELGRNCDVLAVADYTIIEQLLMPRYTAWAVGFAGNEMAIMYRPDSKYAREINARNWPQILLRKDVEYGHSDPDADPCGYRTMMLWQLAEHFYQLPKLYNKLQEKCPPKNVRPKETDLIALLETGELDYIFIYRSVCEQQKALHMLLPEQINLKSNRREEYYQHARVVINGATPGSTMEKKGTAIAYGVTIPKNSANPKAAQAFVKLLLSSEGRNSLAKSGQPPFSPPLVIGDKSKLPQEIFQGDVPVTR